MFEGAPMARAGHGADDASTYAAPRGDHSISIRQGAAVETILWD